jgi:hypothetical protein
MQLVKIFFRNKKLLIIFDILGNCLQIALRKIGKENIVNNCVFNIEWVTDAAEKEVAKSRLTSRGGSADGTAFAGRRVCLFFWDYFSLICFL